MRLDPITNFLYWQMNYHLEHHMYAAVPFHNLRRLHKLVMADGAPQPNRSLWDAWKEIIAIQKVQDQDKTLAYDQFSRAGEPRYVPQEPSLAPQQA